MKNKILFVDDDTQYRADIIHKLRENFTFIEANTIDEGISKLSENPQLILLDVELESEIDGITAIPRFKENDPWIPIIMLTKHDEYTLVVQSMKLGANDYFVKSPDISGLEGLIKRTIKSLSLKQEVEYLRNEISTAKGRLVGGSPVMDRLRKDIYKAASLDCPVLITGETGVGKELTARAIHEKSGRNKNPFIGVNVSALSNDLFSSELFGHEKGSFTSAAQRKRGMFEIAGEGTLLMDEIGDLSVESQIKLLRVIEEKEMRRIGGIQNITVSCRVLASTNRDIDSLMKSGTLRSDLYYRLAVFNMYVPPLRERKEDIKELVEYFLKRNGKNGVTLSEEAVKFLSGYDWPGNVRHLKSLAEIAGSVCSAEVLEPEHFMEYSRFTGKNEPGTGTAFEKNLFRKNYKDARDEIVYVFRKQYLENLIKECKGNITEAARLSGLNRTSLYKMLQEDRIPFGDQNDRMRD